MPQPYTSSTNPSFHMPNHTLLQAQILCFTCQTMHFFKHKSFAPLVQQYTSSHANPFSFTCPTIHFFKHNAFVSHAKPCASSSTNPLFHLSNSTLLHTRILLVSHAQPYILLQAWILEPSQSVVIGCKTQSQTLMFILGQQLVQSPCNWAMLFSFDFLLKWGLWE